MFSFKPVVAKVREVVDVIEGEFEVVEQAVEDFVESPLAEAAPVETATAPAAEVALDASVAAGDVPEDSVA